VSFLLAETFIGGFEKRKDSLALPNSFVPSLKVSLINKQRFTTVSFSSNTSGHVNAVVGFAEWDSWFRSKSPRDGRQ
jgi:hypothetical protein